MKPCELIVSAGLFIATGAIRSASGQSPSDEQELAPNLEAGRRNLGPDPLVLPQWLPAEAAALSAGRPANLGGGLWNDERFPLEAVPPALLQAESGEPALTVASGPLPGAVLEVYARSSDWCVDPQHLIESRHRREIERFLGQHARECRQPLKLWLFAAGQTLPPAADEAGWHRASFGDAQPGVLAMIWPGEAAATRVVFSPQVGREHDRDALRAWREAAVQRVTLSADPARQVDELALWLAVGLVQWERHPPSAVAAASVPAATAPAANRMPFRWWVWVPGIGLALAAAWIAGRRRKRSTDGCEFPEVTVAPRLGAPHSGGSGAVVSW